MIGQTISHYRITDKLGSGGMGVVYKTEDTNLGRTVALKFLAAHLLESEEHKQRFLREAKATASLDHPNICMVYEVGETDGHIFLAMGYVDGVEVRAKIKARPLKLDEALDIAIQAAEGLRAAHQKGIVHRDIKSSNLMLTSTGQVKIMDFGLAQLTDGTRLTKTDTVMGTPAYMSPEQAQRLPTDRRRDIWSLGVVLYEMVTGRLPFEGDREQAVLYSIINEPHEPITALRVGVPPELDRIVAKALAKSPNQRYQHLDDMLVDLRALRSQLSAARVTTRPRPAASPIPRARWKLALGAAAVLLACVAAAYVYSDRVPALTEKDTIVLADFTNSTGEPVFDGALRQGLAIQLSQSPFLSLVSEQRIQQTLRLMGQPPDARLTPELARELCERAGASAVLDGSIASLGSQYILGLRATNCTTGDILDQEQATVPTREDVLSSLSQIAREFRTRVGESLATVEMHSTPLPEATTSSLEALKAFSAGYNVNMSEGNAAAIPFDRRVVEIDPQFAKAHALLGLSYSAIGESVLSTESTLKAWRLRDRVSDREKFFIDFLYDRQVTGNLEKAYQTLELWNQTYPRGEDPSAAAFFAGLAGHGTGRFERVIEVSRKGIAADPGRVFRYSNLATANYFLDRFEEAKGAIERASERNRVDPGLLLIRYYIAVIEGDNGQMDQVVALAKGKRGAEHRLAHAEALALARSGRLQAAQRSSSRAVDLAVQEGQREATARYRAVRGVWQALIGNVAEGERSAVTALELSKGRDVEYAAGLALAFSGGASRSEALAAELEKRFPEDTFAKFTYVPVLRASAAMSRGKPADAIERLQIALRYELAVNGFNFNSHSMGGLHSAYVRGAAFMAEKRYAEAAASWAPIPSARWRTCNSAGCSLCRESEMRRRPRTRNSSNSGKTATPTSRSSYRLRRNSPSCKES
jgi:tetratricopeptide (TPR) repeat protein